MWIMLLKRAHVPSNERPWHAGLFSNLLSIKLHGDIAIEPTKNKFSSDISRIYIFSLLFTRANIALLLKYWCSKMGKSIFHVVRKLNIIVV